MHLIRNRYYTDYGLDYVFDRLSEEFGARGIELKQSFSPVFGYGQDGGYRLDLASIYGCKDVIFWDKDVRLARALESLGMRLFPNCADALAACDDKELTYARLIEEAIPTVETISAPLVFDVNTPLDEKFLDLLEKKLHYPIVVKQNFGSQGKQVYLAKNRQELQVLNGKLLHIPHIYQEFRGEAGCDIRVYVIGGEAVSSVKRKNTTDFKSNVALGGEMTHFPLDYELKRLAERIAGHLNLGYGSLDFLLDYGYVFVEANSNAYFKGVEKLGVPMAKMLAEYIIEKTLTKH